MWHTRTDRIVEEIVHGHEVVPIRLRAQVLRGEAGAPDLSIQRSTRVEGSTRGLVILVHGFAQNRFTWRISRRSFSGFLAQAGYDVLNVELRGHGRSGHAGAGVFTEYVEDVVRVVDALDGETPFVIGHSLGAGVAVGVAVQRPLRGVIHLAGVYDFASTNPALQTFAKRARRVAAWMSGSPARVRTRWIGQLLGRTYRVSDLAGYALPISGWAPGSIERDLLEERLRKGFDWTSLEIWAQLSRWADGEPFPYREAWREVNVPLLVVAGDQDPLVRPQDAALCFEHAGSRDKELLVFDSFDHHVHWGHIDLISGRRAPEIVWPRLREWLDAR